MRFRFMRFRFMRFRFSSFPNAGMRVSAAGAALLLWAASAPAQEMYPAKPIHLVVTTAAGGANDLVARALAERLAESLRQPVVIENQPAGNGGIAAAQVARATPDGHTLVMVVDSTLTVNPHLYRNLAYDPFRDFAPISAVTRLSLVLVTNTTTKAADVRELIALAKASPGKLNYASTGIGTQLHVGMELFKLITKTDIVHVPYRATTAAMADLMGGRIDMVLIGQSSAKALVEGGKLRILAIAAPRRSPLMPDVPTMAEAGVPGYEVSSWFGLLAPARTPPGIIERLAREVSKAAADPRLVAALAPQGMQILASSPEETLAAMRADSKKWGDVIAATGITVNQ
jgi:tripartite-type tricarboxylate transporter receptor subunit TctC